MYCEKKFTTVKKKFVLISIEQMQYSFHSVFKPRETEKWKI